MLNNHLMHPRVANNHADNGYFPTDDATLAGIIKRLDIAGEEIRIFDPCCGKGLALQTLSNHLSACGSRCTTFGVELNKERAIEAQSHLDYVVQADIEDCTLQARSVGLLFLNPPYGFVTKDQFSNERTKRLEEVFFSRTAGVLQDDGILVLIVPQQSLTEHFTKSIATWFTEIRIFQAAVDTYKQYVIMGIRPNGRKMPSKKRIEEQQKILLTYETAPTLDDEVDFYYEVPPRVQKVFRPINNRVNEELLREELSHSHKQTLWTQFSQYFSATQHQDKRRPLCALNQWHSALALAAGQVSGIVTAQDGRKLLIKGSTHKTKVYTKSEEYDDKGNLTVITTATDRFVPSIRAINLTENSSDFGKILTIK